MEIKGYGIAVIGMALEFPGASTPGEFWNNIYQGRNCLKGLSDAELLDAGLREEELARGNLVKTRGGSLSTPHSFDAGLFGYNEHEARTMEPQMRIFHEVVWKALENAGYDPRNVPGSVGVYAGAAQNLYWQFLNLAGEGDAMSSRFMLDYLVNSQYMPTRLSYNFGFKGPSLFLYTACSTSLVSVHTACRALLGGECDIAVAGGSSILGDMSTGYTYQEGMILSPDGQCRAFDQKAGGTVPGEGAGVIVLKSLDAATRDGDNILCVIRSSAINNDGDRKVGFSAPSIYAQADVIRTAMAIGEIAGGEISYIETHGTGTPLGDSVELEGLRLAMDLGSGTGKCVLGTLKPNIGHLDSAAGIAGIIKVILALQNRILPPSLNCDTPLPVLTAADSQFTVLNRPQPWENGSLPLVAGVSAFGIGGTNAHVILEEAPGCPTACSAAHPGEDVVLLSERSREALEQLSRDIAGDNGMRAADFGSLVYTLKTGRHAFPYRRLLRGKEIRDIREGIQAGCYRDNTPQGEKGRVAFVFNGLETADHLPGRTLYTGNPLFRKCLDRCFTVLARKAGLRLKDPFLQDKGEVLDATGHALLGFVVGIALADTLQACGVVPDVVAGDSLGELAAGYTAGVLALDDVLLLGAERTRLLAAEAEVPLLEVAATRGECEDLFPPGLQIVVDNSDSVILACPGRVAEVLRSRLASAGIGCRDYPGSPGIPGNSTRGPAADYQKALAALKFTPPRIPLLRGSTGEPADPEEVQVPDYWVCQLRETLAPGKVAQSLRSSGNTTIVELGQEGLITSPAGKNSGGKEEPEILNPLSTFNYTLGVLWLKGREIQWRKIYAGTRVKKAVLPGVRFVRKEYAPRPEQMNFLKEAGALLKGKPAAEVLHGLSWKLKPETGRGGGRPEATAWLIFCDEAECGQRLAARLRGEAAPPVIVSRGEAFQARDKRNYVIRPGALEDYRQLFSCLDEASLIPSRILHCFACMAETGQRETDFQAAQELGFYSVLNMARSLKMFAQSRQTEINVITGNLYRLCNEALTFPCLATLAGLLKVIPQEYPFLSCRNLDIDTTGPWETEKETILDLIHDELLQPITQPVVAVRGKRKWIQEVYEIPVAGQDEGIRIRKQGTYLVFGGLGDVGFSFATLLASRYQANLVIAGKSDLEEGKASADFRAEQIRSNRLDRLRQLREHGTDIRYVSLDVAAGDEVADFFNEVRSRHQGYDGVIYSAGTVSGPGIKFMDSLKKTDCESQFATKVYGVMNVSRAMRQDNPELCCFVSSLSSLLGGMELAAYAGGNAFLDAWILERNYQNRSCWKVINWDGMNSRDSGQQFARIASLKNIDQIFVSAGGDLRGRFERWVNLKSPAGAAPLVPAAKDTPQEVEPVLGEMLRGLFHCGQVGVDEDFMDLGGDSLTALTFLSMIHKELKVKISIQDFYNNLTIRKLARLIRGNEDKNYTPLKKAEEKEYYRLSPGQKRMYILWKLNRNSLAYNQTHVLQVKGVLDVERLRQAFESLAGRHDAFRTTLVERDGKPFAKVLPHVPVTFALREVAEQSLEPVIRELVKPFNLLKAPLYRVSVLLVTRDSFVLVLDFHHILVDGVSFRIIVNELMDFYTGEDPGPQRFQYKDYTEWLHEPSQQERLRKEENYWLKRFRGDIPLLDLKPDKSRPANVSYRGDALSFYLDTDTTLSIRQAAKEQGVSLYVYLLSVYFVLLYKLTGQDAIVVGTPIAGRDMAEFRDIVGFFVNTLAVKAAPEGLLTFQDFKKQIRDIVLEAFDNRLYPFDELVKKVNAGKMNNRNPLFDTMFVFLNMMNETGETLKMPGLEITPYSHKNKTAQFDLTVIAEERDDKLFFEFEYFTDLFNKETILRYKEYFIRIIEACLEDETIRLRDIRLLDALAEKKLLDSLRNHYPGCSEGDSIQGLFERQVQRHPENQALVFEGKALTYRELNARANRLAHFLREKGVKANTIVGLVLEPSAEMIVAILGVLKAGGTYLPVDPLYPPRRIEQILADSGLEYMLTGNEASGWEPGDRQIFNLREIDLSGESSADPENSTAGGDTAYIIYTSGTTGNPKGVLITHHNVIRLFYNKSPVYDFNAKDRWILCHSYCFDVSVWEIFGALLRGGAIVVIPNTAKKDTRALLSFLYNEKITVLNQTPSAFINLQAEILRQKEKFPLELRYLIFAGENLKPFNLKAFREQYPRTRIINMYGITEITVHGTFKEIGEAEIEGNVSNVGKPLPTLNMYLFDKDMKPVPPGIPGEIFVGGEGVSPGYLNKPLLTMERFIPNPYAEEEILYKSGDLAVLNPAGEIVYIGRNDKQVQIRGFRIETGEIESCLLKMDGVENAFVIPEKSGSGFDLLYAYLKTRGNTGVEDLRSYLKQELPEYMVPVRFFGISHIPLTPNSKIDTLELKRIGEPLESGQSFFGPATELQKKLAEIWKAILGRDEISVHANFFEIGGDSLSAIQVITKMEEALNREIPPIAIFSHFTIELLSQYLEHDLPGPVEVDRQSEINRGRANRQKRLQIRKGNEKAEMTRGKDE